VKTLFWFLVYRACACKAARWKAKVVVASGCYA
jgi:hypothetical protein